MEPIVAQVTTHIEPRIYMLLDVLRENQYLILSKEAVGNWDVW
jgi:hypothetical protein